MTMASLKRVVLLMFVVGSSTCSHWKRMVNSSKRFKKLPPPTSASPSKLRKTQYRSTLSSHTSSASTGGLANILLNLALLRATDGLSAFPLNSSDEALTSYVEFTVQKLTQRHLDPVRRVLCLTETCLVERDPATYSVVSVRPLCDVNY